MALAQLGTYPLLCMPFYLFKAFATIAVMKVANPSSQGFIDPFHHHW
jgi:hypothetical protein